MGHRLLAAIIGIFVMFVLHSGIRQPFRPPYIRFLSIAVATLFVAQVMVGAATVWLTFPVEFQALHLAAATTVWTSLAVLAFSAFTLHRTQGPESSYA